MVLGCVQFRQQLQGSWPQPFTVGWCGGVLSGACTVSPTECWRGLDACMFYVSLPPFCPACFLAGSSQCWNLRPTETSMAISRSGGQHQSIWGPPGGAVTEVLSLCLPCTCCGWPFVTWCFSWWDEATLFSLRIWLMPMKRRGLNSVHKLFLMPYKRYVCWHRDCQGNRFT